MNKVEAKQIMDLMTGKKAIGQSVGVAADGGNAADKTSITQLLPPNLNLGAIYDACFKINTQRNVIKLPQYDTTTLNDDSHMSGLVAQWLAEGEAIDLTKMTFDQQTLNLRKLAIAVGISSEWQEDCVYGVQIVREKIAQALRYQIAKGVLYGNSALAIGGVMGSHDFATLYVSAGADILATVRKIINGYYGGENGMWILSQDVFADIVTAVGDATDEIFDANARMLAGYPFIVEPSANADTLLLGDFTQFALVHSEIRSSISESYYFNSAQNVAKMVIRIQGAPIWNSTMTREDGVVVAPFVTVDTQDAIEESSEEWNHSSSSTSSSSSHSSSSSSEDYSESSSSESSASSASSASSLSSASSGSSGSSSSSSSESSSSVA